MKRTCKERAVTLEVGAGVWVPCTVFGRGAFFNERRVNIHVSGNDWTGFVAEDWLRHQHAEGKDEVLLKVVSVTSSRFTALIPGNSVQRPVFTGRIEQVGDVPVEA